MPGKVMNIEETIDWLYIRLEECNVAGEYCPPVIDNNPLEGFRIDELRWRSETDAAARLMLFGESPTNQSTPVRFYLCWRILIARRALIPLGVAKINLPYPMVLESYLIELWPSAMLDNYLQSVVASLFQQPPDEGKSS